jgi:hypothetical protein
MACRLIEPSSGRPSSIIVGGLIRFIAGLISHIPLAGSGRRSGEIMIDSRELNRPSRAKRRAFAARRFRYRTQKVCNDQTTTATTTTTRR